MSQKLDYENGSSLTIFTRPEVITLIGKDNLNYQSNNQPVIIGYHEGYAYFFSYDLNGRYLSRIDINTNDIVTRDTTFVSNLLITTNGFIIGNVEGEQSPNLYDFDQNVLVPFASAYYLNSQFISQNGQYFLGVYDSGGETLSAAVFDISTNSPTLVYELEYSPDQEIQAILNNGNILVYDYPDDERLYIINSEGDLVTSYLINKYNSSARELSNGNIIFEEFGTDAFGIYTPTLSSVLTIPKSDIGANATLYSANEDGSKIVFSMFDDGFFDVLLYDVNSQTSISIVNTISGNDLVFSDFATPPSPMTTSTGNIVTFRSTYRVTEITATFAYNIFSFSGDYELGTPDVPMIGRLPAPEFLRQRLLGYF